ncbi:tyrosine--tRNA ligase [Candidatus Peribacteria bacterium]|nr:MAG: tyrosine--tRNA ligase [Candidatus Peribacteria bacterium]
MTKDGLLTRGIAKVIPQKLAEEKLASGKKLRMYWGIDPTGANIHLGHAVPLRKMQAFADAGHEVIFLVGSFTAMIGDPSGRDAMREPLTKKQVEKNFQDYKKQASKVLNFKKIKVAYNHKWLEKLSFKDILKLTSEFTVNQMMERDMFERRLKEGMPVSLTEFMYPLMVGYDSVMLDVDVELGGTDQEFNMLAGRTLQKAFGKREKFIMTMKLLEGTDGRKMSKSYDNCIYLTDSAKDMFGKTLSIKDELITTYMECCTDISMEEIADVEKAMKKGANPKEFKVRLAKELVTMYHSKKEADAAEEEFSNVFAKGGVPDDMPEVKAEKGELLIDLLVRAKILTSKSEARRLIEQKAVTMNETLVEAFDVVAEAGVTKVGKRKFVRIG